MIKSMTGFGKHVEVLPNQKITFEIKSLNSKQLDLTLKIPNQFREKELDLRQILSPLLQRGKAEGILTFQADANANSATINRAILQSYLTELKTIANAQDLQSDVLRIAMRMPDVLNADTPEIDEKTWASIMETVTKAVAKFDAFRLHEGQILADDFRQRITTIQTLLKNIEALEPARISAIKERIKTNFEKWFETPATIDENRFEQEVFYFLEKLDISEEKLRLQKHCLYFLDTLNEEIAGKKLGFVTQEIGREINTIGAKANDVNIQKIVVEMKDELEKIKEQLMNVL